MAQQVVKYDISFLEHIPDDLDSWNQLEKGNAYWSSFYFNNLANNPPKGVNSHACLIKQNDQLVAKMMFQYLEIDLKNNFGKPSSEQKKQSFLMATFRKLIVPLVKVKIIVNGNLLLSGSYGFKFVEGLDMHQKRQMFAQAIDAYRNFLKSKGIKTKGVLLKDLDNPEGNLDEYLTKERYSLFKVQPKMKFEIKDKWASFDAYLAGLKSKYRVRYRKARKSLKNIERRLLSPEEVEKYQEEIYELYLQTVSKAGFNLFLLNKDYFSGLVKAKPEKFRVNALFEGERMVAFYTLMDNDTEIDAHYLGYDLSLNAPHKLYLNMLYFMVEEAIELQKDVLHMSRTALEIKSSVGTVPEEVNLHGKYFNSILNRILGQLLDLIVPKVDWEPRNPFK